MGIQSGKKGHKVTCLNSIILRANLEKLGVFLFRNSGLEIAFWKNFLKEAFQTR